MAASDEFVSLIISNALETADKAVSDANIAAQATVAASNGYSTGVLIPATHTITAIEPVVPEVENSTYTYEAQRDQLIALLSDQLADFYVLYYPLQSDAFDEATTWLVNSITLGGTGINPSVEAQIWQRGRDRIVLDGLRAESQTFNEFASRGFILPAGAMAARLQDDRFVQLTKTQELSRDVAIKQADIEVENLRFAVDQAIKSRIAAMGAATDYIRALMSAPDTAARVASINSDAKARMLSATADLYRARLSRDELAIQLATTNTQQATQIQGIAVDGFYKGLQARVSASASAADVYGRTAAAALSSLTSVAGTTTSAFS
jgi:hypothetical protein